MFDFDTDGAKANFNLAEARTGDIRISIGNPAKATAAFGVPARMEFKEGLRLTLRG